jgi:hypothetical protein
MLGRVVGDGEGSSYQTFTHGTDHPNLTFVPEDAVETCSRDCNLRRAQRFDDDHTADADGTPVHADDQLRGVTLHADRDSTEDEELTSALRAYHEAQAEVRQLRRALRTRPTIDQAKGIIMADRRCTPTEAFDVLKKLSMDTNVPLADVAAALVYQAQDQAQDQEQDRS